jgi:hypothetical protein
VRSELDAVLAGAHPGFFSAFPSFEPTLASRLAPDSLGYVGIADPAKAVGSLLEQARAKEPGLATAVGKLVKGVEKLGNVGLQRDLLPSLGGEAAFALEPSAAGGGGGKHGGASQPAPPSGALPFRPTSQTAFLMFLASGIDGPRATQALARLEGPIARALNPSRQAPGFSQHKVGDVTAHSVRLSSTVDLTYAIVGTILAIASDPTGVEQIATGEGGLDGAGLFEQATAGLPGDVSVLGYLNLEGLISLGERAGLAQNPAYATFAAEIRKLQALGLAVQSSSGELATDLRLIVG